MAEMRIQREVMFAGENPLLMLYREGSDELVAVASYWRTSFSPAGAGEALVIWVDPDGSGLGEQAPVGIFCDNAEMATYVWEQFNSHFDRLQGRGIEQRHVEPARFAVHLDGMREYRVTCEVGAMTIELAWRDGQDLFHALATPEVAGSRWEVSNVVVPCANAGIRVDGAAVEGEAHFPEGDYRSSAFLAFAESWVRLA